MPCVRKLVGRLASVCVMCPLLLLTVSGVATAQPSASFPEPVEAPRAPEPAPAQAPPPAAVAPVPTQIHAAPQASAPVVTAPPEAATAQLVPPAAWPLEPGGAGSLGGFRPPVLPAYPGLEPPPGYRAESHINSGLAIGGGVTLAAGYVIGLGYAMSQDFNDGTGWLGAPVIGPWVAIGKRDFDCGVEGNDPLAEAKECQRVTRRETKVVSLLAALGMAQGVGATLLFIGLLDQRHEWVRQDIGTAKLRFDALPAPGGGSAIVSGIF